MKLEIERKFVVDREKMRQQNVLLTNCKIFTQFYVSYKPSVRVRIVQSSSTDFKAFITIKGKGDVARQEFEYEIPVLDAIAMKTMAQGNVIVKRRFLTTVGKHTWEVDEFLEPFSSLMIAEIELDSLNEEFEIPKWVDSEVTFDKRYSNASMSIHGSPE